MADNDFVEPYFGGSPSTAYDLAQQAVDLALVAKKAAASKAKTVKKEKESAAANAAANAAAVQKAIDAKKTAAAEKRLGAEAIIYQIEKQVELNRDLYFVKLVAGNVQQRFSDLVEVAEEGALLTEDGTGGKRVKLTYQYSNFLLSAWTESLETVKTLIDPEHLDEKWTKSQLLYEEILNSESFLSVFASYVAYTIQNQARRLAGGRKTKYEIAQHDRTENLVLLDLMRVIKREYGCLRPDLQERYL